MKNVIACEPPVLEQERKLSAASDFDLQTVLQHVLDNPKHFTPPTYNGMIPPAMPREVSGLRTRVYFVDTNLICLNNDIELRQELRSKYGFKQTIKTGAPQANTNGLLQRVEHQSRLKEFGIDLNGIADAAVRKKIKKQFSDAKFVPVIKLMSQRTKLVYHPAGAPDTAIELGFDLLCLGKTFWGFSWDHPQIELELIKGDAAALDVEEKRLTKLFPLRPDLYSKPYTGLMELTKSKHRGTLDSLENHALLF